MPSPSTRSPTLGAASFPATGPFSSRRSPDLRPGTVSVTQVSRLIDSRWARSALDSATAQAMGSSPLQGCMIAGGQGGSSGSLFPNAGSGLLFPPPVYDIFDMGAAGLVIGASRDAMLAAAGSIAAITAVQSVIGGMAQAQANLASLSFALIEAAITSPIASDAASAIALAARVAALVSNSTALFAGVLSLAAGGLISAGSALIGQLLSGALGAAQRLVGPLVNVLRGIPTTLAALSTEGTQLISQILARTGISAILPVIASLSSLRALFPPGLVGLLSLPPLGSVIAALDAAAISAINSKISSVVSSLGIVLPPGLAALLAPGLSTGTAPRVQGLQIVDGIVPAGTSAGAITDPAAALVNSLLSALSSLFGGGGLFAAGAGSTSLQGGYNGTDGIFQPGALSGSGLFDGSIVGTNGGSLAVGALSAAAALGAVPPEVGDLQAAGFASSTGDLTTGFTDAASDPAPAVALGGLMLADGCAFGTALSSSLSHTYSQILADGSVSGVQPALEDLQATLECRRSSFTTAYQGAYSAARLSELRTARMLAAYLPFADFETILPGLCPAGNGPLGSCGS